MADVTVSNLDDLLYELRVPMQKNYRKQHVLLAELKRLAPMEVFDGGSKARIPIVLSSLQGGGNPGETGTINVPQNFNTAKAIFTLQNVVFPIGITLDAEEDSMDNSAAAALALQVEEARNGLAETVNDQFNAAGAELAAITGGTSPGLTVQVSKTLTNFDRLYPGRVVDILTKATGADAGQGKRRKIDSIDESVSPSTITFATAQTASDGGSGSITFSASSSIYVAGVYTTTANNALQAIHDIASASGTFQSINRATVAGWKAVDGRNGDTVSKMLTDTLMDAAVRRGRRNGGFAWTFAMGEPAVIDGYKQSKYALVRINPKPVMLSSGFKGIEYDGAQGTLPLIPEDRFTRKKLVLVPTADIAIYHGRKHASGPDFVQDDGGMWRRFSRALPKEAWLRDKLQLAAKRCNRVVFLNDLDEAA